MLKKFEHCCAEMAESLKEKILPIKYTPKFRGYSLHLLGSKTAVQLIQHCPWCGRKLPKRLDQIYRAILKKEHGINDDWDPEQKKRIPKEFKTDAWWKKRNL